MIRLGSGDLHQQPISYSFDESGAALSYSYESSDPAALWAYAQTLIAQGIAFHVTNSFGKGRIDITQQSHAALGGTPATIAADSRWELLSRTIEKDILEAGNPLTLATPQSEVWLIKKIVADNTLSDYLDASGNFTPPAGFSSNGTLLLKYITDGVRSTPVEQSVLKHTLSVATEYITPASFSNVGRIISTATLVSTESVPATLLFDLPDDTDPAPITVGGTTQTLQYGWLKKAPEVVQIARRKWQLIQQWEYGLYGIDLYLGQARL